MNRIFVTLALSAIFFMLATFVLGMSLGDVRNANDRETQSWATVHRICGMLAAIGMVFVHSVVVTYFVGTSRWCREVVETYQLPTEMWLVSARLKRRTFPWAVISMLAVVGVAALGGAADPAAALRVEPIAGISWSTIHLIGAALAMGLIVYAFQKEWGYIQGNSEAVAAIMREVRRIRLEKGLDVETPQPAQV